MRGELGGGKVVACGEVVAQGTHVDERPAEGRANVSESERSNDGGKAWDAQPFRRQVDLHDCFLGVCVYGGQQGLQFTELLTARRSRLGAAQDDTEVCLEAALDCIVKREADSLRRGLSCGNAALVAGRGGPGGLRGLQSKRDLRLQPARCQGGKAKQEAEGTSPDGAIF